MMNWVYTGWYIKYFYSFAWGGRKDNNGKVISELLQISDNKKDFTTFIKRDEKQASYKSSKTGRCVTKIKNKR